MPAVGTRRSTRVFVPKVPQPQPSEPARVRRSGKRLAISNSHWLRWESKNAFHDNEHGEKPKPQTPMQPRSPPTRSFGIVYSRKRCRRLPAEPKDDTRFGIVFTRKDKRSKVAPFREDTSSDLAAIPCSLSREFASRIGFLDAHFLTPVAGVASQAGDDLLVVLIDTSFSGSTHQFLRLLLPVLRWMRHGQQSKIWNLASFLSSAAVVTIFASHGLHFVKLQHQRASALLLRTMVHCGWCELHDANQSQPVLSVNFSAVPSYFQSLHSVIDLHSIYVPAGIRRSMGLVGGAEEMYTEDPLEADSWSPSTVDAEPAVDLRCDEPCRVVQDYVPLEQVAGVVMHGLKLKKHQRKRSSMRHPVNWHRLAARFPDKAIGMKQGTLTSQTELSPALTGSEICLEPLQPKPALEISLDLLENMDDSDVSTPMGSNGKQKRSFKSPIERTNERLALSEVRQNIDHFCCKANLLIIQADRCWREEGAVVMLELSNSNGWCVAVKLRGVTRVSLKPSEQRFYVVNRHTHAYVWAIEDGWKLEFSDKWDWLLFKELHIEGRERNSQEKMIPIPGVHEVSDGMGGIVTDPFSRPVPDYIRMVDDEVGRALSRDSVYDLDSEDEQWLIQLNHEASDRRSSNLNHISYEDFEKIITLFEKDIYNNPGVTTDVDQLLSRYPSLGKDDNVLSIYEYWTSKRYKKGAPLIRTFQGAPVRRGRQSQKSSVKKKRSFMRQRSQPGRGKPGIFLQDNAEEEALRRVVEAERAAKHAVETAVRLRSRAQSLMANANLATYKSVMALRIAEAASISNSCRDLVWRTLN
ncbi:uncharacterized protein LOC100838503 isoform X2 [Brachypodium distachyon]|nr:uncharacterized protein LOC100838503 isoform X2 [Brachypodium distachyon]KQJ88130.1 hypothetical protein BRADI_4g15730v3 [Brachypodium distachyon]|eukprot:XP_024310234.1 uncharacterized protein LOC100838503 isoform X2 [Brachypodium distachyon]